MKRKPNKSQVARKVFYGLISAFSFYNMVFIPLQFAYSISFSGWFLALEILTIILYVIDLSIKLYSYKKGAEEKKNNESLFHEQQKVSTKSM
jgi:hypothetical protein